MIVGYLKNTQITTGKKLCVLGEASTQIPSDKKDPRRADLDAISVQLRVK